MSTDDRKHGLAFAHRTLTPTEAAALFIPADKQPEWLKAWVDQQKQLGNEIFGPMPKWWE